MFQWYADAVVCYVYLCDLPGNKLGKMVHEKFSPEFSESFRNCRWWTRGWTLQELLAPRTVVFYTADWRNVGVRDDLTKSISDITLIPIRALRSRLNVVKSYSVAQKFPGPHNGSPRAKKMQRTVYWVSLTLTCHSCTGRVKKPSYDCKRRS